MMLDILATIEQWLNEKRQVALATVVQTWGSSPRQAGAKMGIDPHLAMVGSVSGGCVETTVVSEAVDGLEDHQPRLLNFGVSDDTAWDVGLSCGGKISIYVEALDTAWWQIAAEHARQDKAMVTATIIAGTYVGGKVLVDAEGAAYASPGLKEEQIAELRQLAQAALSQRHSSRATLDDLDVFLDVFQPRPRLYLVGGAHVALALNQLAKMLGFRVVLIDPRRAFATPERFPDVELISHDYPDKAFAQVGLTSASYLAILTHDPKIDDLALKAALPASVAYIGVLSSRRTHEKRIERLTQAGIDPELFQQIHTPIGIEIGANTPEEIALCIMAEIIAVRNGVKV
ncbi:MAG: XdhC family protein [Anaerolineae bacterium]|nr:XdhC family protein [Anaerolineae bacterium]